MPVKALSMATAGVALVAGCVVITPVGPPAVTLRPAATPTTIAAPPSAIAPTATPVVATPTLVPDTPTPVPPTNPPTSAPATAGAGTSEQALLASMLETSDVDPTATTSGVDVTTTADDLPGFAASGGLRRAAQVFDTESFVTIYDFRYQFSSADDAAAFLETEADNLGEVDGGAESVEPPTVLGDDTRYYVGHISFIIEQDSYNYLIRVNNVVAKVWVGGDPDVVSEDQAADIAQAAADKMTAAFGT